MGFPSIVEFIEGLGFLLSFGDIDDGKPTMIPKRKDPEIFIAAVCQYDR